MSDFSSKSFSRDAGDRLVRAWAPGEDGETFFTFSFSITAVDGVMGLGEKRSALVLRSGMKIPVALPHEELEKKIYTPDFREPVLDLREFTGTAVAPLQFQQVKIKAFIRQADTYNVVTYDFSETNITSIEAIETNRSKSGKAVRFSFNSAAKNYPFGDAQAVLDMPYDDYISFFAEAKKGGLGAVDLCQPFKDNPKKYGFNPK